MKRSDVKVEMFNEPIPAYLDENPAEEIGSVEIEIEKEKQIIPIIYAEINKAGPYAYTGFSPAGEPVYILFGPKKDLMVESDCFETALYHEIGHIYNKHGPFITDGVRDYRLECEADDFAVEMLGKEVVQHALTIMYLMPNDFSSSFEIFNRINRLGIS